MAALVFTTAATFLVALLVHSLRRRRPFVRASLLIVLAAEAIMCLTVYREALSGSDKWIGVAIILDSFAKFAASIFAALIVAIVDHKTSG